VEQAAERPVRDPRYQLLDVWRGVACLMVVLHHAGFAVIFDGPQTGGLEAELRRGVIGFFWRMNMGVPLFFVISGYCIAASAESIRRRGAGAWRFLGRRVWRIYPPYWAALLGFVVLIAGLDAIGLGRLHYGDGHHALQLDPPGKLDRVQWVGNITLTEEYRPLLWRPPPKAVYTRVAWSLCYEEQFYLVCFLALLTSRRLFGTLAVVTFLVIGLRLAFEDVGLSSRIDGAFPELWHEFAVGLAVYWRLNKAESAGAKRAVDAFLASLVLIWMAGYFRGTPVEGSTPAAVAFGYILIALRRWDEQAARFGLLAPLRACGRRCYSIYLIHLPVCTVGNLWLFERGLTGFWARVLVMIPVVSSAAVGVSWLFFHAVERHFLNPPLATNRSPARGRESAREAGAE
jgi:peptidoglycan/LPS O-acetylase OafA/YrhL